MDFSILLHPAIGVSVATYAVFFTALCMIACHDWRTRLIPDPAVGGLVGLWFLYRISLGAVAALFEDRPFAAGLFDASPLIGLSALDGIVGGVAISGSMLALSIAFETMAKRPALGGGDIKLFFPIGLFMGLEGALGCLFFACLASLLTSTLIKAPIPDMMPKPRTGGVSAGAVDYACLHLGVEGEQTTCGADDASPLRRHYQATVPFGPGIAAGAVIVAVLWVFSSSLPGVW